MAKNSLSNLTNATPRRSLRPRKATKVLNENEDNMECDIDEICQPISKSKSVPILPLNLSESSDSEPEPEIAPLSKKPSSKLVQKTTKKTCTKRTMSDTDNQSVRNDVSPKKLKLNAKSGEYSKTKVNGEKELSLTLTPNSVTAEVKADQSFKKTVLSITKDSMLKNDLYSEDEINPSSESDFEKSSKSRSRSAKNQVKRQKTKTKTLQKGKKLKQPISNEKSEIAREDQVKPKEDVKPRVDMEKLMKLANIVGKNKNIQNLTTMTIIKKETGKLDEVLAVKASTTGDSPSSSEESDWEEVEEGEVEPDLEDYNPVLPAEGVEITLPGTSHTSRRERKAFDMMDCIRLQVNRFKKDAQLAVHQVHLLCLVAHGLQLTDILNDPIFKGIVLSLVPDEFLKLGTKTKKLDIEVILKISKWFGQVFKIQTSECLPILFKDKVFHMLEHQAASDAGMYNILFVGTARALGLEARLCMSLYPLSYKAKGLLIKAKFSESGGSTPKPEEKQEPTTKEDPQNLKKKKIPPISGGTKKGKRSAKVANKKTPKENKDLSKPRRKSFRSTQKAKYKMSSDEGEDNESDEDFVMDEEDSDNEKQNPKRSNKPKIKQTLKAEQDQLRNRKILSSDSEESVIEIETTKGIEVWCEIYSKTEKRWVCIDCSNDIVDEPYEIERRATQPITYVLVFDDKGWVKDVTRRYCSKWLIHTRKLRVEPIWWEETLDPFLPPETKQDKDEDKELDEALNLKPIPTKITDFKNHPLYALKRHILKFEALYPDDAPALGFIRGEPIYARECIHKLHSRETWVKNARVVKVGEEPYKIVKARPKWDRLAGVLKTDLPLEIFGLWQTEEYKPPVAKDGKVPRNEYGNVELFQPSMLPIGTVHLQIPCLNRVAKKLGIDCSPAVVGFDGHKGSIHPVFDGFVICEEFKDTILAAWEEEQVNQRKREKEKREKRIYGNWKRLIKGVLIREKIKLKYDIK